MTQVASLSEARETIERLFSAALRAVEPERAVRSALQWDGRALQVGNSEMEISNGIHVVAIGKAAVAMCRGAFDALGDAIVSGDVITKDGHVDQLLPPQFRVFEASHPIPDSRGVAATKDILTTLTALDREVAILALISGGGSALLEAPRPGITLEDLAETTALLLRAGAPIDALNAVRAPLSRVKAGGLRRTAPSAAWITLILSDVLSNDPRVIASGPTVPTPLNRTAALAILEQFGVSERVPHRVMVLLREDDDRSRETTAENDVISIVADNKAAVMAASAEADTQGLRGEVIWRGIEGEAAELGAGWVDALSHLPEDVDVVLGGGEATVTVRGEGRGGRNTEFALAGALELDALGIEDWALASLATDGQDALTGVAGAIADAENIRAARARGIDPAAALADNDSLAVFEAAGGALTTGPTGTNVNDLYFAVRVRPTR